LREKFTEQTEHAVTMPKACEASNKMLEGKLQEAVFERLSKRKEKATVLTSAEVSIE
jgi:hypothetical protein